jgi:hypothetical protein
VIQRRFNFPVLLNQLSRAFLANSFRAGNVVDGIAQQRHVVDDFFRRHSEQFLHFCFVDDHVAFGAARAGL